MNIKKLTQGLSYSGEVEGKKQTYYIFAGGEFYLVMSFSATKPGAGNFNIVERDAVDYVLKRIAGLKGITSADVVEKAKKTRHAPTSLAALNILYVLVAMGHAKVDGRRVGQALYFNVKG
jgi:hypothetical protein